MLQATAKPSRVNSLGAGVLAGSTVGLTSITATRPNRSEAAALRERPDQPLAAHRELSPQTCQRKLDTFFVLETGIVEDS